MLRAVVVVVVKSERKRGIVMDAEIVELAVELGHVDLLKRLVNDDIDRRCVAIDDIIQRVYDVIPAKHTETAVAEVKAAVLALVRSPLAELERKLACVGVKPVEEPVEAVKPEEEAPPAEEVKPEEKPAKAKA